MAYLLGNWATDHWGVAGESAAEQLQGDHRQLISSMFDISLPTDPPAMAVARQSVAQQQRYAMGMALKWCIPNLHLESATRQLHTFIPSPQCVAYTFLLSPERNTQGAESTH